MEITDRQMRRQDDVDNAIMELVDGLYADMPTYKKPIDYFEHDISQELEYIREAIWELIHKVDPKAKEVDFYAFIEE